MPGKDTGDWYFPAGPGGFRNFCLAKLTKIPTLNAASSAAVHSRDATNDQKVSEISKGARLRGERACRWQAGRACFPFRLPVGLENPSSNFRDENRRKTRCILRPSSGEHCLCHSQVTSFLSEGTTTAVESLRYECK